MHSKHYLKLKNAYYNKAVTLKLTMADIVKPLELCCSFSKCTAIFYDSYRVGIFIDNYFRYWKLFQDYSMVPNNSAARLLIFKIFSLPTRLIWTYTLIKIQIIFLPTCLLSTIFYFFYLFLMLFAAFFCYKCFNNAFFSFIFLLLLVSKLKKV